ncbi:MAG: FAD-binding oxidoreductase [Halieaceae bacterium]|nr:FAD-binding oxidoreductase [Halieaceae bacterium]
MVIIGGGVIGCSVASHLTKLGRRDVLLLEFKALFVWRHPARDRLGFVASMLWNLSAFFK